MDDRNYEVTNKVFEVLNNIKGFEVAMSNPKKGIILARYKGETFTIDIDPLFTNANAGSTKSFEEIAKENSYIFR